VPYTTAVFSFPIREIVAINEESFDALLAWLDPNRELAAQKYELIRAGLIRIFVSKGFSDAEDLGDTVINRVMKKLPEIRDAYVGEPVRYFHGVARNVMRETSRRREIATETVPDFQAEVASHTDEYDCLVKCLRFLPREKHELILDYHIYDGRDKVVHHRQMAEELGITEGALRGRAHHLRGTLEKCIGQCLERIRSNEKQA
jgi:RNA polymerase sigma factor (sigma-70 family)